MPRPCNLSFIQILAVLFLTPVLLLSPPYSPARTADQAADQVVGQFHDTLLQAMKDHPDDFEQRYRQLEPVIKESFDLQRMARVMTGKAWEGADPALQAEFIDQFTRFTTANYAARFRQENGHKFIYDETREAPRNTVLVKTRLLPGNGEAVAFDYVLREQGGAWKINDIFLKGSFSELATRKAEYGAVIKREGFPALVEKMAQLSETIRQKALAREDASP